MLTDPSVGKVEDIDYLFVERYDRIVQTDNTVIRIHQEDFCQALSIAPEFKYQKEGGPRLEQCFGLVRETASLPAVGLIELLKAVVFNVIIGNCDAHGKNFSLLYEPKNSRTSLAPLYDLVSTMYYSELSSSMAMSIGKQYQPTLLDSANFRKLSQQIKFSEKRALSQILSFAKEVCEKVRSAEFSSMLFGTEVELELQTQIERRAEEFLSKFS